MEFSDEELIELYKENNEDAKDLLFQKYNYIIDIIINKYKKAIYALGIDITEVRQDAMLSFSNALVKYVDTKNTSLPTFITVLVERKIQNCIRSADTIKNRLNKESYSLEYNYADYNRTLEDYIGSNDNNPLSQLEKKEYYRELQEKIDANLSSFEKDVYKLKLNGFEYLDIAKILNKEPKQIDNTIQRVKNKIKDLL